MDAMVFDQAGPALSVAEEDQVFAKGADAFRGVAGIFGCGDRLPVTAQQFAAGRAGTDARDWGGFGIRATVGSLHQYPPLRIIFIADKETSTANPVWAGRIPSARDERRERKEILLNSPYAELSMRALFAKQSRPANEIATAHSTGLAM